MNIISTWSVGILQRLFCLCSYDCSPSSLNSIYAVYFLPDNHALIQFSIATPKPRASIFLISLSESEIHRGDYMMDSQHAFRGSEASYNIDSQDDVSLVMCMASAMIQLSCQLSVLRKILQTVIVQVCLVQYKQYCTKGKDCQYSDHLRPLQIYTDLNKATYGAAC